MNNWRLLLALVAVFQPIASFTHLNNIDGREHCCDRRSGSVLRKTNSLFDGPALYTNTDQRDEIREVRRSDLSFRREEPNRFSKESHLLRNLERDAREPVLQIRSETRLERAEYGRSHERLQVARERFSRGIASGELNRNVYHSRDISRENERQQHLFGNVNDEHARFTGSQQSRRDTPRLQIRSQERRVDSSNKINSFMHKRDTLERFETSNTFNNRRQIARELVRQRGPLAQAHVRRDNDVRRALGDRSVEIRNMRSIANAEIGNNFHFERHSVVQRNERRTQHDNRVFKERANFVQRSILDNRKDGRHFRISVTRMISEARDSESFSREGQNDKNVQRELREDARRFRESQRENTSKVQRNTRTQEDPSLFNNQRIIRSDTRRSILNLNDRFSVLSTENLERRSETRGKLADGIIREVRQVRVTRDRYNLRNDIEVPYNSGQNRIIRSEIRNDETRSTDNRRDIRDDFRVTRDARTRELARDNIIRSLKDLEERQEYARAIRTTESRPINNRERTNEIRRDRTQLNRFGNERVNELKQTERLSVERDNEDRRDARNDIRRNNGRTLEIRNKQSSRDARGVNSNHHDINNDLRLRLSKESRDKRTVENRMATRHSVARFVRQDRIRDTLREVRYDERRARESRGMIKSMDIRESEIRRTWAFERDNVLAHRARSEAILNRNNRPELILNRLDTKRDHSMDREKTFRTREFSTRINLTEETIGTHETANNWQYVLYTLQGIYLCGLFVQMLSPTYSKNGKSRNWWFVPTQTHIKAD